MQVLSALLTLSGAIGLAFVYRDILIGAASRQKSEPAERPDSRDASRSQQPGITPKTLDKETHT